MNSSRAKTLYQLIWQTRRLFQRLRATSDELLDATGINSSQRAVLEFLHGQPPQTVPAIARERTVSRQHIQTVVNDLLELGLVEAIDNPSHKRSPLIRTTAAGEALFASIRDGKPINNSRYMIGTTALALLGRAAGYTGKKITWDELVNSQEVTGPAQVDWDTDPPVKPGDDGRYPCLIPGMDGLRA